MKKSAILMSVALCLILAATAFGGDKVKRVKGQTVFTPTMWSDYSYTTPGGSPVTQFFVGRLVVRSRDPENSIIVKSIKFYDPDGALVTDFLESGEQILGPLASWSWSSSQSGVPPYDRSIPGRPCFIVKWEADKAVFAPGIGVGLTSVVIHGPGAMDITSIGILSGSVIKEKD
jgi:Protein of unknown function (DUF3124)